MKAIVYTRYGPPDVLHLIEVAKPATKDNEVLTKVHASNLEELHNTARKGQLLWELRR